MTLAGIDQERLDRYRAEQMSSSFPGLSLAADLERGSGEVRTRPALARRTGKAEVVSPLTVTPRPRQVPATSCERSLNKAELSEAERSPFLVQAELDRGRREPRVPLSRPASALSTSDPWAHRLSSRACVRVRDWSKSCSRPAMARSIRLRIARASARSRGALGEAGESERNPERPRATSRAKGASPGVTARDAPSESGRPAAPAGRRRICSRSAVIRSSPCHRWRPGEPSEMRSGPILRRRADGPLGCVLWLGRHQAPARSAVTSPSRWRRNHLGSGPMARVPSGTFGPHMVLTDAGAFVAWAEPRCRGRCELGARWSRRRPRARLGPRYRRQPVCCRSSNSGGRPTVPC